MLSYLNVSAVRSNFFFLFGIKSAGIGTLNLLLQLSFQWVDPCFCLVTEFLMCVSLPRVAPDV